MTFKDKLAAFFQKVWRKMKPTLLSFHEKRKAIWKKYAIHKIFIVLVLFVTLITSLYLFFLAKQANVSNLESGLKQVTTIYDSSSEKAGTLYSQKGTYVELDKISPNIQKAVVATEDKRFYTHHGYDIRGILRAFLGILKNGHISGGGSTITQQLAKNAYLTQKQTFTRKARELFLAIELEKKYSKNEILTMYLNNAYFANGVWGVEDASMKYFGKPASEVTVGEAAILAGMLKGPGIYNPIDYPDNAAKRRETVLTLMEQQKIITPEEKAQQASVDVKLLLEDNYSNSDVGYQYPWFFDEVIREAKSVYGIDEQDLLNKGYKVYTTLNQAMQKGMQATYNTDYLFPANASDGTPVQSASVAYDPKTGGVAAIVGGRNEHVFLGFNRGTMASVPPGSTMKPLVSYTPAIESGMEPEDMVEDKKQDYYPDGNNLGDTYTGEMPMYQALMNSTNMPAVWLLHKVGLDRGFNKAKEFGLTLNKEDKYYGLALGGLTTGVSPLTMAAAYGTFANDGVRYEPYFITKIVDSKGAVVGQVKQETTQVITKDTAEKMTSMMQGVFSSGTAANAQPYGYKMAGKTGTTETSFGEGSKDQWMIGYTPDLVISTWMGFDTTSETHYLGNDSSQGLSQVFKSEAENMLPYTRGSQFTSPDVALNNQPEEEFEGPNYSEEWKKFKDQVGEGAKYWGEKIKDGLGKATESVWNFFDRFRENQ